MLSLSSGSFAGGGFGLTGWFSFVMVHLSLKNAHTFALYVRNTTYLLPHSTCRDAFTKIDRLDAICEDQKGKEEIQCRKISRRPG